MDRPSTTPRTDPATWVDAHGDYLYRFALAHVREADAAEDLVQEALLAALAARHAFRGGSSERSWLTGILKRKVADWLRAAVRRRARQVPLPDRADDPFFTRRGTWKVKPGDWSPDDPGQEMTRGEFWAALARCLDGLPVRLRQAFVLRHLDEASVESLCETLAATATNVGVMLHRARLRLWRCLTVRWFGGDEP